jgi:two-component system sensor histidine kinase BaeS
MFRSLWFKLVGAFVGVVLVTLVVVLAVIMIITQREFGQFVAESSEAIGQILPQAVGELPATVTDEGTFDLPGSEFVPGNVTIEKDVLTTTEDTASGSVTTQTVAQRLVVEREIRQATEAEGAEFLANVQQAALIGVIIAGIVAILVGTWLFRQITRPLGDLRSAAQTLADGDLSVRIPVSSADEVGKLSVAFNDMAAEIERHEALRRQMVADVAHELRTPLSVMRGNIEAMMDGLIRPSQDELSEVHDEVLRLGRMVEDLRTLSLADAGELDLVMELFDAGALAQTAVRRMAPLARERGVAIQGKVPDRTVTIRGDEDKLLQALINLIDNGLRHASAGGKVEVEAGRTDGMVFLAVADDGPGIPDEELTKLFDRFWRGDKSRSRGGGGSGLGLAIVQQIALSHGGEVSVESSPSGGSRFVISLPSPPAELT